MTSSCVTVVRSGIVESSHAVHVAVVDETGQLVGSAGNPSRVTFFRSSAKPLQALPLVEDGVADGYDLDPRDLAFCCASHGGEPVHVAGVRALLAKVGVAEDRLGCGAHLPMHPPAARDLIREGHSAQRVHNNCSGKHAGMLALAKYHGWPLDGYMDAQHPVQQRMLDEITRWSGVKRDRIEVGVDGCGVACFALPVGAMALAYARFAAAARDGAAPEVIVSAMTSHPFEVAGTQRLCTAIMAECAGRVFAKVGAEGVYGAGIVGRGLGVGLKVEDGGWRAAEVALLSVLEQLDALPSQPGAALARFLPVRLTNTCGEQVGTISAQIDLGRVHA